jgi:hypothetical protein
MDKVNLIIASISAVFVTSSAIADDVLPKMTRYTDSSCEKACGEQLSCTPCRAVPASILPEYRTFMCLREGNACLISLGESREPIYAFSGGPAKPDKVDQALKVIVDTRQNIEIIRQQRQREIDDLKAMDKAMGK